MSPTLDPYTMLDVLIDEYISHEKRQGPQLGYPSRAAGTEASGSNRTFDSAEETLEASVQGLRMAGMSGAWESLSVRQEQALRIDANNRRAGAAIWRIPRLNGTDTAAEVRAAKMVLASLLERRNVIV